MIDRLGWYGEDGQRDDKGKQRHEKQHGTLSEPPADRSNQHSDCDIACAVERGVATHPPGERRCRDQSKSDGGYCRTQHIADDGHDRAAGDNDRETRP
jgi:hypothetical protein